MSNPLYSTYGVGSVPGPMGNMLQRFQQFKQTFQGDPRQQVQQLLNSGRVTQQQYNQAVQMAQQFQRIMGGKM